MTGPVSKRSIADTLLAFEKLGRPVRAARLYTNGDVLLLTENPSGIQDSGNENDEWVNYAGAA